jgi:hydroxymethylpyrimidine pyrophosphatase-like HAD family hydrolase
MSLHVLYTDVDGTLVGPRGCFFAAEDGSGTLAPAEALVALHDAGVKIVLVSGRTRAQLLEAAMLLGADGFIAEMGALVCWDLGRGVQSSPTAWSCTTPGTTAMKSTSCCAGEWNRPTCRRGWPPGASPT